MTINEYAEKQFKSSLSIKDMIMMTAKEKGFNYAIDKVKNYFGIEMMFSNAAQINVITKWIEELEPHKFKNRITNPYDYKKKSSNPVLKGEFIIKLDKATYLFVSARDDSDKTTLNRLYLYVFGKRSYKWFNTISKISQNIAESNMMYSIVAKSGSNDSDSYWTCVGSTFNARPMDTLFFDNSIKSKIMKHLDDWLLNEDVYKSRGLTFKTGILLYGVAGTGKSSLASAIATYLNCGLISIDTATFGDLNIAEVVESINADNCRYVVLLDEIDTIFANRESDNVSETQKAKISKLLALLDSQQSPNNVIFVATTNYVDRLDKAVIRKGRFDMSVELGNISESTAVDMCKSFNLNDNEIKKVLAHYKNTDDINPADLQNTILTVVSESKRVVA